MYTIKTKIWDCPDAKTGKRKMWLHILKRWCRFDFNHSWNGSYTIESNGDGRTTSVFCNCGEEFYQEKGWV